MRLLLLIFAGWIFAFPAVSEVVTYACQFAYRVSEEGTAQERLVLVFKIDTVSRRAFMEGNAGLADVDVHIGDDAFSFMERVDSGAVQTTTITRDGLAVHSRNTVMLGEIVAAQHFGRCTPQ
jgi:hypothetical protein